MYKRMLVIFLLGLALLWGNAGRATEQITFAEIGSGKVVLPWEELKKLLEELETLKKNQAQQRDKPKDSPPVAYSLTEAHLLGEVKGLSAKFEGSFAVQILKEGWVTIPLFTNEIRIETVRLESSPEEPKARDSESKKDPAHLVRDTKGYSLLAKGPKTFSIQVSFYVPVQIAELTYTLSFQPPPAVTNHFTVKIPEKGINLVQTNPNSQFIQGETTTVHLVLSGQDSLQLAWKKDSGIQRKSSATLHSLVSVDHSDISVFNTIILNHLPTLEQVNFQLPAEVEILNVTSLDIERWSTNKVEKNQIIKIAGQPEPNTPLKIDITYHLRLPSLPTDVTIPTITVTGVDTVEGFLGVEALGNLEIISHSTDQVPIPALPKVLWQKASNPLLYGYQFYQKAFSLSLKIKSYQEIQTVVANVDLLDGVTHRTLEGKSITRVIYSIRNNDRQFLKLSLPDHSHIWQTFLEGKPVKPALKDSGEILIPMKKSASQGEELQSFSIEIGYITEVDKLSLKGDILNQLPAIDIPISYLRWSLYLPEYYEYSKFEGPLKQVTEFSNTTSALEKPQIDIPTQGQHFFFEKPLVVAEKPYVRGKYGQFLGDDIFLFLRLPPVENSSQQPASSMDNEGFSLPRAAPAEAEKYYKQQVIPNRSVK